MRKTTVILVFVGVLLVATVAGSFGYMAGLNQSRANERETGLLAGCEVSDNYGKMSYPLLDIFFGAESEWLVAIRTFAEQEAFSVTQNGHELQHNKEWLRVLTFPVGRGTTPNGIVYVYQNQVLIREIPYLEVYFDNEVIKKAFQPATKDEVENLINPNRREFP